ncbi:MAG: hypothetical protein WDO70_01120 [Alphaproteobacteria bacterium]
MASRKTYRLLTGVALAVAAAGGTKTASAEPKAKNAPAQTAKGQAAKGPEAKGKTSGPGFNESVPGGGSMQQAGYTKIVDRYAVPTEKEAKLAKDLQRIDNGRGFPVCTDAKGKEAPVSRDKFVSNTKKGAKCRVSSASAMKIGG